MKDMGVENKKTLFINVDFEVLLPGVKNSILTVDFLKNGILAK
jgi:hypothetical protein